MCLDMVREASRNQQIAPVALRQPERRFQFPQLAATQLERSKSEPVHRLGIAAPQKWQVVATAIQQHGARVLLIRRPENANQPEFRFSADRRTAHRYIPSTIAFKVALGRIAAAHFKSSGK
jgi:hypothetical protein